jgi:hypothetical protein
MTIKNDYKIYIYRVNSYNIVNCEKGNISLIKNKNRFINFWSRGERFYTRKESFFEHFHHLRSRALFLAVKVLLNKKVNFCSNIMNRNMFNIKHESGGNKANLTLKHSFAFRAPQVNI